MSPGSSRTSSVPGSRWSRPVAGARWAAQTSAASPTASARDARRPRRGPQRVVGRRPRTGRGRPRAARAGGPPRARAARGSRPRRRRAAGTRTRAGARPRSTVPTVRWSVGSNARSESISSPKNSIRIGSGSDGGKTSTMPPRRANSPRPATSSDRHVAEVEQLAQQRVLVEPRAEPQLARRRRAGRPGRSCAGAAPGRSRRGPGPGRSATRRAPRPGPRSRRRRARCARRPARSAARGRRPPPGRPATPRAPRRRGRRSRRRGRSRPAARRSARARAPPRGRSSRRAGPATSPTWRPDPARIVVRRCPAARAARRTCRSPRAAAAAPTRSGQAVAARRSGLGAAARASARRRRRGRRRGASARARVLDLGVDRGDVEVDRVLVGGRRVPGGEVGGDLLGDPAVAAAPAAERRRRRSSGIARPCAGRTRRQPVLVRRMPSASGGPSTSPGAASRVVVGRPQLEHVEPVGGLARALARPRLDRVGGRVEQLVEPLLLVGRERATGRGRRASRSGSPIPTRSRLNFSVPSSSMIERRPLWPPGPPPSRKRSLPNGSAKSSATTSRSASGACSRASTLRTARPDSFM